MASPTTASDVKDDRKSLESHNSSDALPPYTEATEKAPKPIEKDTNYNSLPELSNLHNTNAQGTFDPKTSTLFDPWRTSKTGPFGTKSVFCRSCNVYHKYSPGLHGLIKKIVPRIMAPPRYTMDAPNCPVKDATLKVAASVGLPFWRLHLARNYLATTSYIGFDYSDAWKLQFYVRVKGGRTFLLVSAQTEPSSTDPAALQHVARFPGCQHLRGQDSGLRDVAQGLLDERRGTRDAAIHSVVDNDRISSQLYRCGQCPTEYTVALSKMTQRLWWQTNRFGKQTLRVKFWSDLGVCNGIDEGEWRLLTEKDFGVQQGHATMTKVARADTIWSRYYGKAYGTKRHCGLTRLTGEHLGLML